MTSYLSASKIHTYSSCSALYYYKYLAKLPDRTNAGAARGTACHDVFEIFLNKKKYEAVVYKINRTKSIPKSVTRLLTIYLKRLGFYSDENIEKCHKFLLTGFETDFYCEKGLLQKPETYFDIIDKFKVRGFIDKHALFTDNDGDQYVEIWDYKGKKKKFSEAELKQNMQAFIYLMAAKTLYPNINLLKSKVKFVLLDYPEAPVQEFQLENMSEYNKFLASMEEYQKLIDSFGREKISSGLAKDKGFPKDKTFSGLLVCGIGVKNKGDLKKDGSLKYHCPFRFPFDYYTLVDKAGKVHYSGLEPKFDKNLELKQFRFPGCCGFYHPKITESVEDGEDENHYL